MFTKNTVFQCYKRDFVKGKISREWKKTGSIIELEDNATSSMLIDGSGYYLDDPDNRLQYFVDMKKSSETENSINNNGCPVCAKGAENYTAFQPSHRPDTIFYQYDYRHANGELFSTVAPTLEECRDKRNKWLNINETNK
jgi:hypothetical protein